MKLEIITPERIVFSGNVGLVTMPGISGSFTILENHAPMISILSKGKLVYKIGEDEYDVELVGGFIEVNNNVVTACLELN